MVSSTPEHKLPYDSESTVCDDGPLDHGSSGPSEYTRRHREAWLLLVRSPGAETLKVPALTSWQDLWGQLGVELYRCFQAGDAHVHANMILLARQLGGWRGRVVANRLERWRCDLFA